MQHKFQHIITWLVALSILNCSIGTPDIGGTDFGNTTQAEMAAWNEFESIYEWVLEEALDMENAIPEQPNERGNQHNILKKHATDFVAFQPQKTGFDKPIHHPRKTKLALSPVSKPLAGYVTLFSPPPDLS